ncbi:MAG TPA: hypothetical protein VFW66_09640 [Gemmatimonadales bacterium]|nr:hypothetical protein [Gemmatimonadales bacterium]
MARDESNDERDYERVQRDLNPHRVEEQRRAREHAAAMLEQREVRVLPSDSSEDLADLLDAVDRFTAAVEAKGGDTMVNTPDSSDPKTPAYVLPIRGAGESVQAYRHRVVEGTERLLRSRPV